MEASSEDLRQRIIVAVDGDVPERGRPDATLAEHGAWYEQTAGVRISGFTMSRLIARLGQEPS